MTKTMDAFKLDFRTNEKGIEAWFGPLERMGEAVLFGKIDGPLTLAAPKVFKQWKVLMQEAAEAYIEDITGGKAFMIEQEIELDLLEALIAIGSDKAKRESLKKVLTKVVKKPVVVEPTAEEIKKDLLDLIAGRGIYAKLGGGLRTHPGHDERNDRLHATCEEYEKQGLIRRCRDDKDGVTWEIANAAR